MSNTEVILVDERDNPIGEMEKFEAHRLGRLHRAFSVFIFNNAGEMLLQQRAFSKYHSGGLWTNACCSHPSPGEEVSAAALRRLSEEMGFTTPLEKVFHFIYRAEFGNGLIEYEFDHVFAGVYDGDVKFNPDEVADFDFKPMHEIETLLSNSPEEFTEWFKIAFSGIRDYHISSHH